MSDSDSANFDCVICRTICDMYTRAPLARPDVAEVKSIPMYCDRTECMEAEAAANGLPITHILRWHLPQREAMRGEAPEWRHYPAHLERRELRWPVWTRTIRALNVLVWLAARGAPEAWSVVHSRRLVRVAERDRRWALGYWRDVARQLRI